MKTGIELSGPVKVEILHGLESLSSGTWSNIRYKFLENSSAPLYSNKIFFSVIAYSQATIKSASYSTFSNCLNPLSNNWNCQWANEIYQHLKVTKNEINIKEGQRLYASDWYN